ncbi:hypothetical protein AC578_6472 [Pseudocercospora eumusae]|uniref:Uncharacterized protein n=1 Tax=Pseudocercospora eumusae TaxID=321146 RepID=A0A139HCU8_9PEZI|nr:hypothetical protein AC578_6472 [Pseudocercospora eumusae]
MNLRLLEFIEQLEPDGILVRPCVLPRSVLQISCAGSANSENNSMLTSKDIYDIDRTFEVHPESSCYNDLSNAYGLLNSESIMAHCSHLTLQDMENLRHTQAGVAHIMIRAAIRVFEMGSVVFEIF